MNLLRTLTLPSLALLSAVAPTQIGPQPYLQTSDSPWFSSLNNGMFYLEDFEDGALNTPGVTASVGGGVMAPSNLTDSVDGDDGVIDGLGRAGRSYLMNPAATGVRFTFGSGTYGVLPTHAGLVWTDGHISGSTRFEAFDGNGISLGVITGTHPDGNYSGGTSEDRFYGWTHSGGIGSLLITNSGGGGLEIDHLQYGAVPEPATMTAISLGLAAIASRRRKK